MDREAAMLCLSWHRSTSYLYIATILRQWHSRVGWSDLSLFRSANSYEDIKRPGIVELKRYPPP